MERAIYKDIPQAFGVDNPALLERMVYALAGQIAGIVAPERLARALGISQPTVARYLAYLERSFLGRVDNYASASRIATMRIIAA